MRDMIAHMKLTHAHITNFRSVEDSGEFRIDNVTCLVGKNEAGKSAILTALSTLNPHPATPLTLDKERDYPRRYLTQYDARHPDGPAIAVTTRWQLEKDDLSAIDAISAGGLLKSNEVVVYRCYGEGKPQWRLEIDFAKARESLFEKYKLDATERAPLKTAETIDDLKKFIEKLPSRSEKQEALLADLNTNGAITSRIIAALEQRLPQFMYFSNYDRMEGAIQIEQLRQLAQSSQLNEERYRGDKLFSEFLDYAGVPLDEILAVTTYETFNAKLQAASNNITDQILDYWTQNPDLMVQVKIEQAKSQDPPPFNNGTIARARIFNNLHRVDTPFSERSAGFVWFFSFLVKFAQVKEEKTAVVLLLDEPGLSLHGKAQADLLRYFDDKLSPHHQIVYSTHSPFMVAADRLLSARIVEDQVTVDPRSGRRQPDGTKVREDILSRDPDTLFPLQGALGYEITQTLFIGKRTLLVEGPGDILYLKALSAALARRKRLSLDPTWTICPAGGIGNIRSFMALFKGNDLDVSVLTDFAQGQKSELERLKSSKVLEAGRILSVHQFTDKSESDIEDLFEPEAFVELLNAVYELTGKSALTVAALDSADVTVRLVKKAEAWFRVSAPDEIQFDHYRPAEWLILNPSFLDQAQPSIDATLDRAEKLFAKLNSLKAAT